MSCHIFVLNYYLVFLTYPKVEVNFNLNNLQLEYKYQYYLFHRHCINGPYKNLLKSLHVCHEQLKYN